ncbi:MAG: four helix bundle protein [Bacteroidetes bacterium]|nr:four helix bundle protein [Bacteroidota bacterium]
MNKFKDLSVWQKAVELATEVYKISKGFPSDERFGLTAQITRSAVSVPSNIAEGAGRNSNGEFRNFLGIATGSIYELETQALIANKLGYVSDEKLIELELEINEIQRMMGGLMKSLTNK